MRNMNREILRVLIMVTALSLLVVSGCSHQSPSLEGENGVEDSVWFYDNNSETIKMIPNTNIETVAEGLERIYCVKLPDNIVREVDKVNIITSKDEYCGMILEGKLYYIGNKITENNPMIDLNYYETVENSYYITNDYHPLEITHANNIVEVKTPLDTEGLGDLKVNFNVPVDFESEIGDESYSIIIPETDWDKITIINISKQYIRHIVKDLDM